MNKIKSSLLLCMIALFLAACGQRGPLYLPGPGQIEPSGQDEQPEPPEEETEEKDEKTPGA
jgi:predicted small lipoprotein YifL